MFGAIIGGLGALAGGLLSSSSKNKATAAQKDVALQELEYQKELHKNQIQWRVEDAKKAGLHPMASLGLSSYSYSPVSSSIDTSGTDYSWMGDIGQNIDRAIQQGKTKEERQKTQELNDKLIDIQIRKGEADADLAETNAAEARFRLQQQLFPPTPPADSLTGLIPGVSSNKLVSPEPMRTTPHTETGKEPGSNPAVGWLQNDDGSIVPVMSAEAKQRLEEDLVGTALWNIRNRVTPHVKTMFGQSVQEHTPPKSLLPKGAVRWEYAGYGEYVPVDSKGNRVRPR